MKKYDVICVGAAIVDIPLQPVSRDIFDIESYPLNRIAMHTGGDAINEATILTRLGIKTLLISAIGEDAPGNFVQKFCCQEGIDLSGIVTHNNWDTSINVGLVTEDGERTFVTNRNGSLWKMTLDDVDMSRFKDAKLLSMASIFNNPLLDGDALVSMFRRARQEGLIICADMIMPRLNETLEDIREALSFVDYFFPNYDEAALLTGKKEIQAIADEFLACGIKYVIIKKGKDGCYICSKDRNIHVPAVSGINPIDTIGAGDNFVAGFITAILSNMDLKSCGQFANATASLSVESVGACSGVKCRSQVEERLKSYLQEEL